MDKQTIRYLVELRQDHGYSQERLARELNVSRQAVSNWERGEAAPDTDNLITLARLYGTGLDALLGMEKTTVEARANGGEEHNDIGSPAEFDSPATAPHSVNRKRRGALAAAVIVGIVAIGISAVAIGAWLKFPGGAANVLQHYEISGEIIDSQPTYLGVQYVVRGTATRGKDTSGTKQVQLALPGEKLPAGSTGLEGLYTVLVSNEDTQFLSEQGKKIDNDFLSLTKGASAVFTLEAASDTLPSLAKADTVRTFDAKGTNLGYRI